jgi:2-polyprenyl-3-methyl-5-hydroxy-6-metoxy-1,4-benzoquinol methylase
MKVKEPPDGMPIFPLDRVRNAVIQRSIEPVLESVREDLATFPFAEDPHGGDASDILRAFDASRPRLNVIASMLSDVEGKPGADISIGLGFLPVLLRRRGLDLVTTEHDPETGQFARAGGDILPYTIGIAPAPIDAGSLHFLVVAEVLEHLNLSPVRVLRELASLLVDGGRLILTTPNIARLQHIELLAAGENFLEPFDESFPADRPATDFIEHVREYSIREVVEAVEAAGLRVDEVVITGWGENGYAPLPNPYVNEIIVVRATK